MIVQGSNVQDSVRPKIVIRVDNLKLINDSVFLRLDQKKDASSFNSTPPAATRQAVAIRSKDPDTTSVCPKGSFAGVTFYNSGSFILKDDFGVNEGFPGKFIEKNNELYNTTLSALIRDLKEGGELPARQVHYDWIIGIVLVCAYLYSLLKSTSKSMRPELTRFFYFRGINDPGSRDMNLLFNWQSTILNLISFLIISLFLFCAAAWYDFVPKGIPEILFWFICFGAVIISVTMRHLVCAITGSLSGRRDLFNEYILNVYRSYRFSSYILFILVVLIVYTVFLPPPVYFMTGVIFLAIIYLFRVTRLLLIFLKQDISVFYLILYLCALEILPVLISLRYLTGPV